MKRRLTMLLMLAFCSTANAALVCDVYDDEGSGPTVTWKVGQPTLDYQLFDDMHVDCYATGAELSYIRQHFTSVRMRDGTGHAVFWSDDDARYILNNL